nr:MAG TPA: DNA TOPOISOMERASE I [Caudoviricetes sp.]
MSEVIKKCPIVCQRLRHIQKLYKKNYITETRSCE